MLGRSPGRLAAVAVLLAGCVAPAASAATWPSWSAPRVLARDVTGTPAVATRGDVTAVAWGNATGCVARCTKKGYVKVWVGGGKDASGRTARLQAVRPDVVLENVAVAVGPRGQVVVGWIDDAGSTCDEVHAALLPAGATTFRRPVTLSARGHGDSCVYALSLVLRFKSSHEVVAAWVLGYSVQTLALDTRRGVVARHEFDLQPPYGLALTTGPSGTRVVYASVAIRDAAEQPVEPHASTAVAVGGHFVSRPAFPSHPSPPRRLLTLPWLEAERSPPLTTMTDSAGLRGFVWTAWHDDSLRAATTGSDGKLHVRRLSEPGQWALSHAAASDAAGDAMVAFTTSPMRRSGAPRGPATLRLSVARAGHAFGPPEVVTTGHGLNAHKQYVAVGGGGTGLVAYEGSDHCSTLSVRRWRLGRLSAPHTFALDTSLQPPDPYGDVKPCAPVVAAVDAADDATLVWHYGTAEAHGGSGVTIVISRTRL